MRKKFRTQAVTAGVTVALALAAGLGMNKAVASDQHQQPVSDDADDDLLSNLEELALGYQPFRGDQNRNEIPDGAELARRCAAVITELPAYPLWDIPPDANGTYRICHEVDGLERCDVCGEWIHMGGCCIINPKVGLRYPDPHDPLDPQFLPDLALHYMQHGSFDCLGSIHSGRVDLPRLMRVLELRFPYDPNEHQLPLDYPDPCDPGRTLAADTNDADSDLLADSEELAAGYNLYNPDQDQDLTPDGIELAKQCAGVIDALPEHDLYSGEPAPTQTYKERWFQRGVELCEICGGTVNMGYWRVINPNLGQSVDVYDITCHYMRHGSFSYSGRHVATPHGPFHYGRADIALLATILEMPRQCGQLGILYLPSDSNRDCRVNLKDMAELAENWLNSTEPE